MVPDSVGLGAYGMDSHNCQRVVRYGRAVNEGNVEIKGFPPYPISYRSIIPAQGECANLLVPVCASASHIAFGSLRMEPVFMVLAESWRRRIWRWKPADVQDIDYNILGQRLRMRGQVLAHDRAPEPRTTSSREPVLAGAV